MGSSRVIVLVHRSSQSSFELLLEYSPAVIQSVLSQSLTEFKKPRNTPESRRSPSGKIAAQA